MSMLAFAGRARGAIGFGLAALIRNGEVALGLAAGRDAQIERGARPAPIDRLALMSKHHCASIGTERAGRNRP